MTLFHNFSKLICTGETLDGFFYIETRPSKAPTFAQKMLKTTSQYSNIFPQIKRHMFMVHHPQGMFERSVTKILEIQINQWGIEI